MDTFPPVWLPCAHVSVWDGFTKYAGAVVPGCISAAPLGSAGVGVEPGQDSTFLAKLTKSPVTHPVDQHWWPLCRVWE